MATHKPTVLKQLAMFFAALTAASAVMFQMARGEFQSITDARASEQATHAEVTSRLDRIESKIDAYLLRQIK